MVEPGEISEDLDPIKTFSALTRLQYDRFIKWKDGNFTVGALPHGNKIEDVPLPEQPESLTRAHLELTIGDPLLPGIEMWWLAKLPETVGLRYTLSRAVSENSSLLHSTISIAGGFLLSE
jgi:L-lysine epsilon oxidase C-terminal domain